MTKQVQFFGQTMSQDAADYLAQVQLQTQYVDSQGLSYRRIPYGSEKFREPFEASGRHCRHCNTIFGKLHEPLCDYEECPKCHWQVMSCDCEFPEFEDED